MNTPQAHRRRTTAALKAMAGIWLGSVAGALFAFLLQVLLARRLGSLEYGMLNSAVASIALVAPLVHFGIPQFWLKAYGEEGWCAQRWVSPSFRVIQLNIFLIASLLMVWAMLGPHSSYMRYLLIILLLHSIGQLAVDLLSAKLQLEEHYTGVALLQCVPQLSRLALVILVAFMYGSYLDGTKVAIIYALVAVFVALFSVKQLKKLRNGSIHLKGHGDFGESQDVAKKPSRKDVYLNTWPIGVFGALNYVYFQSQIVMVNYLSGPEAAGQYSVAYAIIAAIYLLPTVIYQKFLLPKTHRWANNNREKFRNTFNVGLRIMLVLGILAMIIIWVGSSYMIPRLFGEQYSGAVTLANILAIGVPLQFAISSVSSVFVSHKNLTFKLICMGIVGLLSVVMNFVFIPVFGPVGAAWTSVGSAAILLLLYANTAKRYVFN